MWLEIYVTFAPYSFENARYWRGNIRSRIVDVDGTCTCHQPAEPPTTQPDTSQTPVQFTSLARLLCALKILSSTLGLPASRPFSQPLITQSKHLKFIQLGCTISISKPTKPISRSTSVSQSKSIIKIKSAKFQKHAVPSNHKTVDDHRRILVQTHSCIPLET
jgi:hypothetical protein